jgi:hypothetical protein
MDHLCVRGYRYDSSAFPAIPYYLAKAAVMAGMRLVGKPSGAILARPGILRAPRLAYRPSDGDPYRRGSRPLVEIPMAVTPWLRLPVIGTFLVTLPPFLRRRLVATALEAPLVNLELHGIDVADADTDGIPPALVARQHDLRLPAARKLAALDAVLSQVRAAGATFCPLGEALDQLPGDFL